MAGKAQAAVLTAPRKFEFQEFAIPEIGPEEAVIRMEAAGLCGTDYEQYAGHLTGTPWDITPIIPGLRTVVPPSTFSTAPVTQRASSEARNAAGPPKSSGTPIRPAGRWAPQIA